LRRRISEIALQRSGFKCDAGLAPAICWAISVDRRQEQPSKRRQFPSGDLTGADCYGDLLPPGAFPMTGVDMNDETAGMLFFLFLSAFGFFFSRLLLN
jgi:hypothetical protein